MLQASQIKQIDPKALLGAEGTGKANLKANGLQDALDAQAFAGELEASLATGVETKPVEVAAEQVLELPSTLVNPSAANGNAETVSPKIFDPALTEGVEKLIQPKTTEVPVKGQPLEVVNAEALPVGMETSAQEVLPEANPEIAQALLKTPQLTTVTGKGGVPGEAQVLDPAMVQIQAQTQIPAQVEVDPQLFNLEDFVAQKNMAMKKTAQGPVYGMMKIQPEQKLALENDLKSTEVVTELEGSKSPVNSQQFILNMMNEQKPLPEAREVQAPVKVFDMSHIKTANSNEIVSKITDYIVQAKASKEPTVNMRMSHDELGLIDITVSRTSSLGQHPAIAINIGAHSTEGKTFFQQNTRELFSHMANAGLNVADMKIETPSQAARNDFDFGQQSSRQGNPGQDKQFASEQNQRRHDQERRQDLWKLLNKEAA